MRTNFSLNTKIPSLILFHFLIVLSIGARALSVDEAIAEAEKNSPKIQQAMSAASEAGWKKREAWSGFLPRVGFGANYLLSKQYAYLDMNLGGGAMSVPQVVPTSQWGLSAELPLFEGFAGINRLRAGQLASEAAEDELGWARFALAREVRVKFYQALAAQKLKEVADQNLATLQDHLKQIQNLNRSGAATKYDVLRVEVQLNEASTELLKAEDDVILARQRLAQAMGLETDSREVIGDLPTPHEVKDTLRSSTEIGDRKDLQALANKVQASEKLKYAARSYWVPKLSLSGNWSSYNNRTDGFDDTNNYRWSYLVALNLTWNIFDGMVSLSREREATEQSFQVEKSLQQGQLQAKYDREFWSRRLKYSVALFRAKSSDLAKAQESVRLAKEGHKVGSRTSTEVLDAELDLFRARAGVVNAQVGSVEAMSNLEIAIGRDL